MLAYWEDGREETRRTSAPPEGSAVRAEIETDAIMIYPAWSISTGAWKTSR